MHGMSQDSFFLQNKIGNIMLNSQRLHFLHRHPKRDITGRNRCSVFRLCISVKNTWLPSSPSELEGKEPRKYWNATALAYLGDSVWELYARRKFLAPPKTMTNYYENVVSHVRAEYQADALSFLSGGNFLSPDEHDIVRWGRNASGTLPRRLGNNAVKREIYRSATALECLTGYLYLKDSSRLHDMMTYLGMECDG